VKSLADPVFGGSVPEVATNLSYYIEYSGHRTRDYKVTVFEHPRLERADVDVRFPEYTARQPKRIENTRRLSAVVGSHLDVTLKLNKPIVAARLVPKSRNAQTPPPVIELDAETNQPVARLKDFTLEQSNSYDLQLTDAEGRTNKVSAQFVFEALTNRSPELRLASPRGDVRPSALEEISFDGTVWDDFGIQRYGLGYTVAGQETKFLELGSAVPGQEKRSFQHLLRLEELGVQPDQLVAWFLWADDIGPDGNARRSAGDLFFGEVRPFEEVFREGQAMEGQGMGGQQRESQSAKLAELQKQIINATWRLQRDYTTNRSNQSKGQSPKAKVSQFKAGQPDEQVLRSSDRRDIVPRALAQFMGQRSREQRGSNSSRSSNRPATSSSLNLTNSSNSYREDAAVVRDSQGEALDQAQSQLEQVDDPRGAALWRAATEDMEKALSQLKAASNSPAALPEALAAEQAAYQALLKLQEHEYSVVRSRNRSQGGGGGRQQQLQRQLEQMDLTQSENRYETQRQAQSPQNNERREQLQIMNRLQELARRQQDLNDRFKELQTALQEAKTEEEREEIRRRLKRLQEEQQQMLADLDEMRQRMDQPENQSRMADERRQLDQTRDDLQRAADAAAQGTPSQALASGTRAQRQLQELREQMRKQNSSRFAEDMRQMRAQSVSWLASRRIY
jgi:hypothetical protein